MKKIIIGMTACLLAVALVGCSASQSATVQNIDSKMQSLQDTINNITSVSSQQLSLENKNMQEVEPSETGKINFAPTGLFNNFATPYYSNVNTYGFNPFGFYGFGNPYGMGNYNYGLNGVGAFNPTYNMGYNSYIPSVNNMGYNNFGRWASNIDTYRINSVTEDGKTTTTIDTFHNGEPVTYETVTNEQESENQDLQNLNNVCEQCAISNNYGNNLKNEILDNINQVRTLSNSIKNSDIHLNKNQIHGVNEMLDNISKTQAKMNMVRGEFNKELDNVERHKETYKVNPINVNSKYVKLLSCMDTRNSYLQNILNSLLQMENCIDGNCQNGLCWNGICFNPNMTTNPSDTCNNCQNCPECATCDDCNTCNTCSSCKGCCSCNNCNGCDDCLTCKDCLFCTDCDNCENCFNCYNCQNCKNLANVSNYCNNQPCTNCENGNCTSDNQGTQTDNTQKADAENQEANNTQNPTTLPAQSEEILDENTDKAELLNNVDENKNIKEELENTPVHALENKIA